MSLDLRNELRRATANSDQPPHDYGGDLARGQDRLRRHRLLVAASAVPAVAAAVAAIVVGPLVIGDQLSSPPIAASPSPPRGSTLTSPPPSSPSHSTGPHSAGRLAGWHATQASLERDVPKALGCQAASGYVWSCNGSVGGKGAMAYWVDARGIVFGDPALGVRSQAPAPSTPGAAYPSEVWQVLAPYLVNARTADKVTAWLQQHSSGRTTIDSLRVIIDGPVASVGVHWTDLNAGAQTPAAQKNWRATGASLKRDMPTALNCTVTAGEMVWVCNGSTQGKAAKVYWSNARGIAFGDPRAGEHPYLRQSGTSGVAYPSEVWRAIAPYLVSSSTADKITGWLQNHNSGSTTIDGLHVQINGPIAGVGLY